MEPCVEFEYSDGVPSLFDQLAQPGATLDEVLGGQERRALMEAQRDMCCFDSSRCSKAAPRDSEQEIHVGEV